jgi:hypothetical protein
MKDLVVTGFEDRPGVGASIGEAVGNAGVNIEGLIGSGKLGEVHLLVEDGDADSARSAIEGAGLTVSDTRDAILVDAEDTPGSFGRVARRIADAGVNVDYLYVASRTRLVFVVDDVEKARAAVGS